ncbi:MAG: 5-formyltetrahydrofolate cyclo-ligase, partial [Azospirillaceae bacterium]
APAAASVAERVLAEIDPAPGTVVSVYLAFRDELDTLPLLGALHARGCVTCAPVVGRIGEPLTFRRWWPGVELEIERFGTARPAATAGEVVPGVLIVPMLAFDRAGTRMGYGAGFYDRTLARLRAAGGAFAVGTAFAAQEVEALPAGAHDQPLDRIVTENESFVPAVSPGEAGSVA